MKTSSRKRLEIFAVDSSLQHCWGIGEVEGIAYSFVCDGHTEEHRCTTAQARRLLPGSRFIDSEGQGYYVHKNNRIIPHFGKIPGDNLKQTGSAIPVEFIDDSADEQAYKSLQKQIVEFLRSEKKGKKNE